MQPHSFSLPRSLLRPRYLHLTFDSFVLYLFGFRFIKEPLKMHSFLRKHKQNIKFGDMCNVCKNAADIKVFHWTLNSNGRPSLHQLGTLCEVCYSSVGLEYELEYTFFFFMLILWWPSVFFEALFELASCKGLVNNRYLPAAHILQRQHVCFRTGVFALCVCVCITRLRLGCVICVYMLYWKSCLLIYSLHKLQCVEPSQPPYRCPLTPTLSLSGPMSLAQMYVHVQDCSW